MKPTNRLFLIGSLAAALAGGLACLGPGTLNEAEDCDATGAELVRVRCLTCHSIELEGAERAGAPEGIDFDTDDDVQWYARRIRTTVFEKETMPPSRPLAACEQAALEAYLAQLRK